ncbi:MAG TPA: pyruvate, water dikinase regulatory protein [Atopostipes sp.]|nr:pyruvate, water dikinase regulatory protein [Atopostipes sp.]
MPLSTKLAVYIVSDAIGQSAVNIVRSALSQFPNLNYIVKDYTFISEISEIDDIIAALKKEEIPAIILHTFSNNEMTQYLDKNVEGICDDSYDLLTPIVKRISKLVEIKPKTQSSGKNQGLDSNYFNRIEALEFAVQHDDGKEPKGFLEADVVILGISRTSKTPLSIYLANNNLKVANLPLVPESDLPEEIWEVDPKRIIGLTNDVSILSEIRKERMIAYGMNPETFYSNTDRIEAEIYFAEKLYSELNCKMINVANKSIEETAGNIIAYLNDQGLLKLRELK